MVVDGTVSFTAHLYDLYCCITFMIFHFMGVREGKIRGAERNLPDFFGFCPSCQKKFSGETFQNCCRQGGRSDYEKFLLDSIFPTKLTEFVPFIFIISQYCPTVKRILPDWLCLPNKLGGGGGLGRCLMSDSGLSSIARK